MAQVIRISDGQRDWRVTVDGTTVRIDGVDQEFVVTPRADGRWAIQSGGETRTGVAARTLRDVWTGIDGHAASWQAERGSGRARSAHTTDDGLRAPMSATVVRVHVAAGDTVAEGDPLVVVEAMKMEMPVRAPRAGVVRVVHCREGELVPPGAVLVELE
jgi:biotin carboxyl carrier protein